MYSEEAVDTLKFQYVSNNFLKKISNYRHERNREFSSDCFFFFVKFCSRKMNNFSLNLTQKTLSKSDFIPTKIDHRAEHMARKKDFLFRNEGKMISEIKLTSLPFQKIFLNFLLCQLGKYFRKMTHIDYSQPKKDFKPNIWPLCIPDEISCSLF